MNYRVALKYKNLILLTVSIAVAFLLSGYQPFVSFLLNLGQFGYIGAIIAGILFVSTFTASIGVLILFILAESLSPLEIGFLAGIGAVLGDFLIFRFVRDNLEIELKEIYNIIDPKQHFKHVLHSKYFAWTLPVIGAALIASPLPDEIGVSLLGFSKMKPYKFMLLSFILNFIGIFLVISASKLILH